MRKALSGVFWGGVLAGLLISSFAQAYTINDTVWSAERDSRNRLYYNVVDAIGGIGDYDVAGINVSLASGKINLELYTSVDYSQLFSTEVTDGVTATPATYTYSLADVFIGTKSSTNATFKYALVLSGLGMGLYEVDSWFTADDLNLETDVNGDPYNANAKGVRYGSKYYYKGNTLDTLIAIDQGTLLSTIDVGQEVLQDGSFVYRIVFDYADISALGTELEFFWAGATCGNDAIRGTALIPEPSTFALLGLGFLGLWRVAGRRGKLG